MTKTDQHPALKLIDRQRKQVQRLIRACEGMTRQEANDAFSCVLPTLPVEIGDDDPDFDVQPSACGGGGERELR